MRRRELHKEILRLATPIYGDCEASMIARIIFEEVLGVTRMQLLTTPDEEVERDVTEILRDVERARPVQYIVGEAEFCDMRFVVREGVLIPRPESEELIRWIVAESKKESVEVLDIGTGSGALAISLSVALPHSHVTALEISDDAIRIAKENIERLSPKVDIIKGDALKGVENYIDKSYDIIVSNPPYIPRSEEQTMHANVTRHEPHLALFVPDDDPLLFYRSIARSAIKLLRKDGRLYFEIHENYAIECETMLREEGFQRVERRLDINDKERMICAQRE